MAVKQVVSDKHPLIIRVTDEQYKMLCLLAVETNESVNQLIVRLAIEAAEATNKKK